MTFEPKFKLLISLVVISIFALIYIQVTSLYTSPVHKIIKKDETWLFPHYQPAVTHICTITVTREVFRTIIKHQISVPTSII